VWVPVVAPKFTCAASKAGELTSFCNTFLLPLRFVHNAGVELAVLSGHPEEVYGLKFISTSTDSSAPPPAADAADEEQQPSGNGSSDVSDMLVTASGESVFLWDLHTGQMLHECAPPPVAGMSALNVNGSPSNKLESSTIGNHSKQQQQQQQQAGQSSEEQGGEETQAEDEEEEQAGPPLLSYIFSLAAAEGTSWLAGACADGMLRLWDAGGNRLQEVAAVQVGSSLWCVVLCKRQYAVGCWRRCAD
jgi:WD40 repeat protein